MEIRPYDSSPFLRCRKCDSDDLDLLYRPAAGNAEHIELTCKDCQYKWAMHPKEPN